MSEFADGVTAPEPAQETPQTEDYLATFVGEGKKYGSVEEAAKELAKKAVNADAFIETLKAEKHAVESQYAELQTRNKSIDEIVQALKEPEPTLVTPTPEMAPAQQEPQDISGEVTKVLAQMKQEEKRQTSIKSAWESLAQEFGDADKAKVAVATYINGDAGRKQVVDTLAITDPASLVTILKKEGAQVTFAENSSGRSAENTSYGTTLTWDVANKMKADNPKTYYSPAFRKRMREELI